VMRKPRLNSIEWKDHAGRCHGMRCHGIAASLRGTVDVFGRNDSLAVRIMHLICHDNGDDGRLCHVTYDAVALFSMVVHTMHSAPR